MRSFEILKLVHFQISNIETNLSTHLAQRMLTNWQLGGLHDGRRCVKNGTAVAEEALLKVGISNVEL